jgi:hypothetical protein
MGVHMEGSVIGLTALVYAVIVGIPIAQILHRVGFSRWWIVVWFIPPFNLVALWMFAFGEWPTEAATHQPQDGWSAAEKETFKRLLEKQRG